MTAVTMRTATGPDRHEAGGTGGDRRQVRPDGPDGPDGPVSELTVLYDAGCRLCRAAQQWLAGHDQLVPLRFVPAGSPQARRRFRGLDHRASMREVTVVADTGQVWTGDSAWLTCLWALTAYRGLAHRLATPRLRPLAGRVVSAAAWMRDRQYGGRDDRAGCGDECRR